LNNDITTAEVSPSEEADWLQCLLNSLMAAHRPEDTKRFGVGRYTLDEVSLLLALSLSETGAFSSQLRDHMWAAVERSELRLRDEVTGLFVGEKHQRNGWGVVTRQDVNAWLEVNEVRYRWDDPSASTCGSETPETNRTAEAESAPAAMLAPEPTASAETAPAVLPSVAQPMDNHEWRELARILAQKIIKRQSLRDLYPSQLDIADEIAVDFRQREPPIHGAGGKPLSGAYIKRWALKGISSATNQTRATRNNRGK